MSQQKVELLPLNLKDQEHVLCLFTVRTHPQVTPCLHGPRPLSFEEHVDYLSHVKNKDFFLLKAHGKLCGYCQRTHFDHEIELGWAIHPDYWGLGIGNGSVQEFVNQSLHFAKPLILTVLKSNPVAIKLYQKHHFLIEDDKDTYYKMRYEPQA